MTIVIAEHRQAIILAIQNNDVYAFRALLAYPELTQEQRWNLLLDVINTEELIDKAAKNPDDGSEDDSDDDSPQWNMLAKIIREEKTDILAAIFEAPGLSTDNINELFNKTMKCDSEEALYKVLTDAATKGNIEIVRMLVLQARRLAPVQRFEILRDAIHYLNEESCYLKGSKDEQLFEDLQEIKSLNIIVQTILQSCSDLTPIQRIQGLYPNYFIEDLHRTLILAARYGDVEIFKTMLRLTPMNINGLLDACIADESDGAKDTVLMAAVRNGHVEVVDELFNILTPDQKIRRIQAPNLHGETPFMIAIKNGYITLVHKMLSGCSVDQELELLAIALNMARNTDIVNTLATKLALARYKKRLTVSDLSENEIVLLLEERDQFDYTVLMQAVDEGDIDTIQLILSHMPKVSVEKRFELLNAAIGVAIKGQNLDIQYLDILQNLLASCSDLTIEQRFQGFYNNKFRDVLNSAARHGEVKMVQILLSASDLPPAHIAEFLNKVDEDLGPEDTALIEAARNGHGEVIDVIFKALGESAEIIVESLNCSNAQGETALIAAARNGHIAVINRFVNVLSKTTLICLLLTHKDNDQQTALMHANGTEVYGYLSILLIRRIHDAIVTGDTKTAEQLFHSMPLEARLYNVVFTNPDLNFDSMLMCAVEHNNLPMIKIILKDFTPLEQLQLLVQMNIQNHTALRIAEERGHTDIIDHLQTQILDLVDPENWSWNDEGKERMLLSAVNQGSFEMVKDIFLVLESVTDAFKLDATAILLLHRNKNGKTALIQALENRQMEIVSYLIFIFQHTMFNIIKSAHLTPEFNMIDNYQLIIVPALLKSIPPDIKLHVLTQQFEAWQGSTIPMMAVYFGYFEILPTIFSGLSIEQKSTIFHMRNHDNKTILMIAQEQGFEPMVAWLQALGARLPAAPLNDAQSTHNVMVHDSVARSAVSLMVRYLNLTPEDSLVLKTWAEGRKDNTDNLKKDAMQRVVQKETTQQAFQELMQGQQLVMNQWVDALSPDVHKQHKQAAAKRAIDLIRTHPEFISYLEGNTKIGLEQLLSLVWSGIHDEQDHGLTNAMTTFETRCENGRESLVIQLFEAIRDKNFTNGQDLDPLTEDRRKCPDGFFNNLTGVLVSLKPEVAVLFVSKATVALKALFLISTLFDTAEYTKEEIIELDEVLEETNLLSSVMKHKLAPKIMQALHVEFDKFIHSGVIHLRDLEQAVINALEFRGQDSFKVVTTIVEKIKADSRVSKDATEEEAEQEPESGTVGMKRKRSRSSSRSR